MTSIETTPSCADLEAAGFDQQKAAEEVWEALLSAGAFIEAPYDDPFIFASGIGATIKVNAEVLDKKPRQRTTILGHVANFPCIQEADALLYVPEGMRNFVNVLGHEIGILVVQAKRVEGGSRYDFEFIDPSDEELALSAEHPRIIEDVVTTLGSVDGMARLLRRGEQDIHSVSFLIRGEVNPDYQVGLIDHHIAQRQIPTDKVEFRAGLTQRELELLEAARESTG